MDSGGENVGMAFAEGLMKSMGWEPGKGLFVDVLLLLLCFCCCFFVEGEKREREGGECCGW